MIEVNVAPSASFAEQRNQLETLYAQARIARLSTESFDFDGTHSGTGGGTTSRSAESPRRFTDAAARRSARVAADLLAAAIPRCRTCSQAASSVPRRRLRESTKDADALYELEIAFAEIARLTTSSSGSAPSHPWSPTGRCATFSPTSPATPTAPNSASTSSTAPTVRGRLGLLELRGFEMPPHHQMAMVQSLLVRSLVAWFWDEPLRAPLIRHGQNLHGRYLLPHFIIHDIADVAADLRTNGIDFDTSWFDPFTEFRFPRLGTAVFDNVELEPRRAIEPWNTLGENRPDPARRATWTLRWNDCRSARSAPTGSVTSSSATDTPCRCWPPTIPTSWSAESTTGPGKPPERAASTITVDTPLRFEILDLATGTSRGGCTYHVSHPGGRAYDTHPSMRSRPNHGGAGDSRRLASRPAGSTSPTFGRSGPVSPPT